MDVFFLDLNTFDRELLTSVASRDDMLIKTSNVELKSLQHLAGRFLLDHVAQKYYSIEDTSLILKDDKPVLKNSALCFSISHCKNLVVVAFDDSPIGIDVEQNVKDRDFLKLILRFDKNRLPEFEKLSFEQQRQEFYKFWTRYEAKFKLGKDFADIFFKTFVVFDTFTMSIASPAEFTEVSMKCWEEL